MPVPELRRGRAEEPEWGGFRAAVLGDAGRVALRSRRFRDDADFPEIVPVRHTFRM